MKLIEIIKDEMLKKGWDSETLSSTEDLQEYFTYLINGWDSENATCNRLGNEENAGFICDILDIIMCN